jgi:xanthosine utilization system XapX-like protein
MNDFWQNVSRYPRYLISFTLGVLYSFVVLFKPLAQKPITLVGLIGLIVSASIFLVFTMQAMLGITPVNW